MTSSEAAESNNRCTTTLFFRNVPFECERGQVEAFFAEFGPLESCFLISATLKQKDEQAAAAPDQHAPPKHSGYGFVKFATAEDAKRAVEELAKRHGVRKLGGRRLHVEFSVRKSALAVAKKNDAKVEVPKKRPRKEDEKEKEEELDEGKPSGVSSFVLVSEAKVPPPVKAIEGALRKGAGLAKPLEKVGARADLFRAFFASSEHLAKVIKKCHGKAFDKDGAKLFVIADDATLKAHRLIIRNVAFSAARADLLEALSSSGTILELSLPLKESSEQHRGFAFVQFAQKAEAEAAMNSLNGKLIARRPVAVDWAVDQRKFQQQQQQSDTKNQ